MLPARCWTIVNINSEAKSFTLFSYEIYSWPIFIFIFFSGIWHLQRLGFRRENVFETSSKSVNCHCLKTDVWAKLSHQTPSSERWFSALEKSAHWTRLTMLCSGRESHVVSDIMNSGKGWVQISGGKSEAACHGWACPCQGSLSTLTWKPLISRRNQEIVKTPRNFCWFSNRMEVSHNNPVCVVCHFGS